ncbi:MAG: DUF4369 domain-containing protein, partial [Bacteroidota bacterium]
MRLLRKVFFLILGTILTISCSYREVKKEGFVVSGKFLHACGQMITLSELLVNAVHPIDSIVLDDNGQFLFSRKTNEAGFYLLNTSSGEKRLLLLEKDENVKISSNFSKKPIEFKVEGSPGTSLLEAFYQQSNRNLARADSLSLILRKLQETRDFYKVSNQLDPLFDQIIKDQKRVEKEFIELHSNSLASIIVLHHPFGMNEILNPDEDFPLYLKLDSTLMKLYPGNQHVLFLHQQVLEKSR